MRHTVQRNTTRVLVLGATGMLGNAVLRLFSQSNDIEVRGTSRSASSAGALPASIRESLLLGVDVEQFDTVVEAFGRFTPDVVINCVGLVKQVADASDPLRAIPINSMLPHRLARLCAVARARLIHISTDCVFDGMRGMYTEADFPNARDMYGRSKLLGEVDYDHAITLRTSIIGHELASAHGLVCWFLAQGEVAPGFTKAVFSGLPTVELARVIRDAVLPNPTLRGVYHVSADPIAKSDLLRLLAEVYDRSTKIVPDDTVVIDRSLDSARFRAATGYAPAPWPELVRAMRHFG